MFGAQVRDREVLAPVGVEVAGGDGEGIDPVVKSVFAPNEPLPWPSRTETLFAPWFATARSSRPSWLKSPVATEMGNAPVVKSVFAPNEPLPWPRRTETLFAPKFATARSSRPSCVEVAGGDGEGS